MIISWGMQSIWRLDDVDKMLIVCNPWAFGLAITPSNVCTSEKIETRTSKSWDTVTSGLEEIQDYLFLHRMQAGRSHVLFFWCALPTLLAVRCVVSAAEWSKFPKHSSASIVFHGFLPLPKSTCCYMSGLHPFIQALNKPPANFLNWESS